MILRAAGLLVRLRGRRLLNLLTAGRRKGKDGKRSGSGRRVNWWLPALVVVVNLAGAIMLSYTTIAHARERLDGFTSGHAFRTSLPLSAAVQGEVALVVALACMVALLMSLGTRELANPDWDLEWLSTLPLPLRQLLAVRLAERSLVNPIAILTLWPLLSVAAWYQDARWLAPLAGLLVTLPLLVVVGSLHLLADTGLRMRLSPPRLRNLQALFGLLGLVGLYLILSAGQSDASLVHDVAEGLPGWFRWTPPGLAVRALTPGNPGVVLGSLAALVGSAGLAALGALALLRHLLRDGLLTAGARESARRVAPAGPRRAKGPRRWITALQARELKLLSRDRAFLVQTLVLPVVILGAQFVFNMRLTSDMVSDARHLGAAAFAVMAYALLFSTFQTLSAEGHALWLLFTFPRPLDALLREKARLWSVVALVFPSAVFAIGLAAAPRRGWDAAGIAALVLAGVPIYATIGTCLGVLGWDPLSQDQRRRIRPGWAWLYMLLAALFTRAIFTDDWWERGVLVVLAGGLAWSLWQRVHDRLPFLLDPGEAPPPRVSLSDGMVAVLLFFVLQALVFVLLDEALDAGTQLGQMLALGYAIAGGVTYLAFRLVFAWRRTQGAPRLLGDGGAVRPALLLAAAGALAGAATPLLLARVDVFSSALDASRQALLDWPVALPLLAVLAAPVCEEYIFRGLVFAGLRRSLPFVPAACASAAIFAIVHPPVSMGPVFLLGVLAAAARERTGGLLAPMAVHAAFNAGSLAVQAWG